jgi:hypothetical protein
VLSIGIKVEFFLVMIMMHFTITKWGGSNCLYYNFPNAGGRYIRQKMGKKNYAINAEIYVLRTPIFIYLYFHFHQFVSAVIWYGASFLGIIGFMLHGMMGNRERCASLTIPQISVQISLNKSKRFI